MFFNPGQRLFEIPQTCGAAHFLDAEGSDGVGKIRRIGMRETALQSRQETADETIPRAGSIDDVHLECRTREALAAVNKYAAGRPEFHNDMPRATIFQGLRRLHRMANAGQLARFIFVDEE